MFYANIYYKWIDIDYFVNSIYVYIDEWVDGIGEEIVAKVEKALQHGGDIWDSHNESVYMRWIKI